MEFTNDLMAALRNRTLSGGTNGESAGSGPGFGPALDWPGLHARLSAAYALRQLLKQADSRPILLDGGFSDWPVTGCDGVKHSPGVNLNDSTDGKAPRGMKTDTAAQVNVGGRGQ